MMVVLSCDGFVHITHMFSSIAERQWAIFRALLETLNAGQMTTLFHSLQFLEVLAGKEGTELARTHQLLSLESALRVNEPLTDTFSWNIIQFMEMLDDLSLNAIPEMVQEMNRPQDVLVLQNIAQDGRASHSNTSSVTLSTAFAAAQTATSGAMPIDLDGTYDTAMVGDQLETASIGTGFMSEGSTPATASVVKQETSPSSAEPWKTDE